MPQPTKKPAKNESFDDEAPPQFCAAVGQLTEEQKKWPVVRVAGGRLVRVDAPDPPPSPERLLAAVSEMLSAGFAGSAEAIFNHLRAAGLTLKTEIGADGVLRVTTAPAPG